MNKQEREELEVSVSSKPQEAIEEEKKKQAQEKIPGFPKTYGIIFKADGKDDRGITIKRDGSVVFFGGYQPNVGKPEGFEPFFVAAVKDFWDRVSAASPLDVNQETVEKLKILFCETSAKESKDYWNQITKEAARLFWDQVTTESPTVMLAKAADHLDSLSDDFEKLGKEHEKQGQELQKTIEQSQEILGLLSEKDNEITNLQSLLASEQQKAEGQVHQRDNTISVLEKENKTLEERITKLEEFKAKMQSLLQG